MGSMGDMLYVYGLYSIGIHVKCILMQWPKGNKEYKPPLRENRSFLLIYVQRVLEASSLRVYGFLMRHSFEFIHLFLELHGTKSF